MGHICMYPTDSLVRLLYLYNDILPCIYRYRYVVRPTNQRSDISNASGITASRHLRQPRQNQPMQREMDDTARLPLVPLPTDSPQFLPSPPPPIPTPWPRPPSSASHPAPSVPPASSELPNCRGPASSSRLLPLSPSAPPLSGRRVMRTRPLSRFPRGMCMD